MPVQGKSPDFVLEVASVSTEDEDTGPKRNDYAALGILEYWRFDPTGEFHGTKLAGDRLVDGVYQPIPIDELDNDVLQGYSAALNLILRWEQGKIAWHDPATGEHIPTLESVRSERIAAEARADEARADRLAAEAELRAIREARLAAKPSPHPRTRGEAPPTKLLTATRTPHHESQADHNSERFLQQRRRPECRFHRTVLAPSLPTVHG